MELLNGLWLPKKVAYRCRLCQKPFFENELRTFTQHVNQCRRDHEEQIQEMAHRHRYPLGEGDVEMEKWVEDNKVELIEGRKGLYGRPKPYL